MEELKPLSETGVCKRCRRTLTDPVSVLYQLGPVCRARLGIAVHKDKFIQKVKFKKEEIEIPEFDLDSWLAGKEEKDVCNKKV